jgi:hypothetical protein
MELYAAARRNGKAITRAELVRVIAAATVNEQT